MKKLFGIALAITAFMGLLMAQAPQTTDERTRETRARQNAQNFELNATVLTFYDREGKVVGTAGERAVNAAETRSEACVSS